jgi:hypothetical protein
MHVLLIGAEYPGTSHRLPGPYNDLSTMKGVLSSKYALQDTDFTILTDQSGTPAEYLPTIANIRRGLADLVEFANAETGPVSLIMYYTGHGVQVADTSGDEADGRDEAMLASDGLLRDDVIHEELNRKLPENAWLCVLADTCHSATIIDPPYVISNGNIFKNSKRAVNDIRATITSISACADARVAYSVMNGGRWQGAFTIALKSVLGRKQTTYDVVQTVRNIASITKNLVGRVVVGGSSSPGLQQYLALPR